MEYACRKTKNPVVKVSLPRLSGEYRVDASQARLAITCANDFQAAQFNDKNGNLKLLGELAKAYFARPVRLEFSVKAAPKSLSQEELRAKVEQTPLFQEARDTLGAYIVNVRSTH